MGIEQRQHERFIIPGNVKLNHESYIIDCQIENISSYGAYLKIDRDGNNHNVDIGDQVTFSISIPERKTQEISGHILRTVMEGVNRYLAVYFFQPYSFE